MLFHLFCDFFLVIKLFYSLKPEGLHSLARFQSIFLLGGRGEGQQAGEPLQGADQEPDRQAQAGRRQGRVRREECPQATARGHKISNTSILRRENSLFLCLCVR